jgi:hypothetical protein
LAPLRKKRIAGFLPLAFDSSMLPSYILTAGTLFYELPSAADTVSPVLESLAIDIFYLFETNY